MSREVRRVPITFDWPLHKIWHGYLTPDNLTLPPCPDCINGSTHAGAWLHTLANRLDMLASDIGDQQRGRALHPWLAQDQYPPVDSRYQVVRPSEDILDLLTGLTGLDGAKLTDPMRGSGATYRITRKIVEAAGLDPDEWGTCPTCQGHATVEKYPGQRAEAEAWEPTAPPEGEGWQLWETVSEGSPISPVFATADALADWMSDLARGDRWVPKDVAVRFIAVGWAPTGISTPATGFVFGVEAVGWADGQDDTTAEEEQE